MRRVFTLAILSPVFFAFGCAPKVHEILWKGADPQFLLKSVCESGQGVRSILGSVRMSLQSPEASGKFSASIEVSSDPPHLRLEAMHPLGGTEAVITIDGDRYTVQSKENEPPRKGSGSWNGIPILWAHELFLGKLPCPTVKGGGRLHLSVTDGDELVVEIKKGDVRLERYVYLMGRFRQKPWPTWLRWETGNRQVEFRFSDPEERTRSPLQWEAKSSSGEVKVYWRDREVAQK
jgi:hypothetical protein